MVKTFRSISTTVFFGKQCKENFLPLQNNLRAKSLISADIALAGLSTVGTGYRVKRSGHKISVLLFTTKGKGTAKTNEGILELTPGTLLINPAGVPIEYFPETASWSFFWFHINPSLKWKMLFDQKENLLKKAFYTINLEYLMRSFITESISRERNSSLMSELYARLVLLYLEREINSNMDNTKLSKVWNFVNNELSKKWTIKDLANIAAMSPDYFAHISSGIYDLPPMKMVTKLRMEKAKELLFTEEYKLRTIAEMVGYEDQFAFSTAFKRHEGISPKMYKLKNR
ncbi:MAG: hypothetical protein A2231_00020 [Candidatus Firestonebacteria bacterium RIFOXYA2_FULL_40_8]|nr:MAG: hypothetical protein A2231_00020 [Candidatus Firestonebacteria bacterium RIFOXYA2_FULL_40_8]